MSGDPSDTAGILNAHTQGDPGAASQLMPLVYTDLKALAVEVLKPRDEDYARAFGPLVADGIRAAYERLWKEGAVAPRAKPGQSELALWLASSDDLIAWTGNAERFPGGYRKLGGWLQPGLTWIRWKFLEPGETLGMAYDGLVWMDDHWAWFPKPWHAMRLAERPPETEER